MGKARNSHTVTTSKRPDSMTFDLDAAMADLHSEPPRSATPWTDEERQFVEQAKAKGYSARQISKAMGGKRSVSAINNYNNLMRE